jgi:hypothetical protein
MPTSYSTDLKIALMATGENAGTWGDITNTNLVVIQQAIAGYESISIAGGLQTTALVMSNAALSNARNAVIKLTGTITGDQTVTVPAGIEKTWIVSNGTSGTHTVEFKPVGGTGATWSTTDKGIKILYSDGTNITTADLSSLSGTVATAQIANYAVNTAQLATNAVTAIKITQSTITQAKLAANSVGANQIVQSTITQAKLAANSVGSNQLIATAVTPATYTSATITVDADGRITAASSGSAGAGMGIPTNYLVGPASGTFTASANTNRFGAYMYAGGGGGGSGGANFTSGGAGGVGGFGFYNKPITQPFAQPYSVGAGGNTPGGAGGNTTIANVGTVNGGSAGNPGSPGNTGASGNAPGASLTYPTRSFVVGGGFGIGGNGNYVGGGFMEGGSIPPSAGSPGVPGVLVIFENNGT